MEVLDVGCGGDILAETYGALTRDSDSGYGLLSWPGGKVARALESGIQVGILQAPWKARSKTCQTAV